MENVKCWKFRLKSNEWCSGVARQQGLGGKPPPRKSLSGYRGGAPVGVWGLPVRVSGEAPEAEEKSAT